MNEFGVIIGQFQPFDTTRLNVVRFALSKVQKLIIVLGGHQQAKTIKNPWSTDERREMIQRSLTWEEICRVEFVSVRDYLYNENLWIADVQAKIDAITAGSKNVALIGRKKRDNSFPQWNFIEAGNLSTGATAAKIREMYFRMDLLDIARHVPAPVLDRLKSEMMDELTPREEFMKLKDEFQHVMSYKELWAVAPYPPTFVTADAVVIKSGHVLVVRRKGQPGKGLIALPGGFLNNGRDRTEDPTVEGPDISMFDASLRELREETGIRLSREELATSIRDQRVFDHPDRSLRGRTITHAFCFNLGSGPLPTVKGSDDAEKAWWMSLRDVLASEDKFFEDHFHIINHFINKF